MWPSTGGNLRPWLQRACDNAVRHWLLTVLRLGTATPQNQLAYTQQVSISAEGQHRETHGYQQRSPRTRVSRCRQDQARVSVHLQPEAVESVLPPQGQCERIMTDCIIVRPCAQGCAQSRSHCRDNDEHAPQVKHRESLTDVDADVTLAHCLVQQRRRNDAHASTSLIKTCVAAGGDRKGADPRAQCSLCARYDADENTLSDLLPTAHPSVSSRGRRQCQAHRSES